MFIFYLHHEVQTLPQHTGGWPWETWKALQKFSAAFTASTACSMEGPCLWLCTVNPAQCLLVPNRGRSWYFLLQDVRSACLPAWENADVPESIFAWIDAEREGVELEGSCQGQPGGHSLATKTWALLREADFTSVSVESKGKMFSCSFKVSSSKCHHDETLLDHLFPRCSATNMFHVVYDADTWMWEKWVQRTRKCHVTTSRYGWAIMKSKELYTCLSQCHSNNKTTVPLWRVFNASHAIDANKIFNNLWHISARVVGFPGRRKHQCLFQGLETYRWVKMLLLRG